MAVNDRQMVDDCIKENELCKLLRLPDLLEDFSEASIVKSVEWLIQRSDSQIKSATKHISQAEINKGLPWPQEVTFPPFSDRKSYTLNVMLCQRFTPQFLQEETRSLSFDCVLSLTKYLQFLLEWSSLEREDNSVPSLDQVIDWLNALLDGHFQQMKLAEDAGQVLESLHSQVTLMAKWQQEAKVLQGTLAELSRQFEEQQKNTQVGSYCIEVISF